jgi:hypothetical protein
MDKEDAQCIALLAQVDKKRKEMKALEAQLTEARQAYGKRRGMRCNFNEWNLRNTIAFERRLEDDADRDEWERACA